MRVFANAPGPLPPMARPNESAPSLLRARSALPRTEGMTEAFDDHMRRSLAERALGPVQAKPAIDTGYGDLIAAARAPLQRMPDATGMPTPVRAKMEGALGADFSDVRVHTGSARAVELGALAFTQGSDIHVAPGQWAPETTKGQELLGHELGHVLQQRTGRVKATAQLKGVGLNDEPALEAEADAMGARAARGDAAQQPSPVRAAETAQRERLAKAGEALLDQLATPQSRVSGTDAAVQRYTTVDGYMYSANNEIALASQTQNLWATSEAIAASNTALAAAGKGSALRLTAGEEAENFRKVGVEWKASKLGGTAVAGATKHTNLDAARTEDPLLLWADCSKASAEVSGSSSGNRSDDLVVMNKQGSKGEAKPGQTMKGLKAKENDSSAAKFASAVYLELLDQFIAANKDANYMVEKYHYKTVTGSQRRTPLKIGSVTYASADKVKQAGFAADVPLEPGPRARALYDKLGDGRETFDAYAGINRHAAPDVGESYSMATEFSMPGSAAVRDGGNLKDRWVYHYAGVVMADGSDRVALENYSVSDDKVVNTGWTFEMYGTPTQDDDAQGQTFHEKHLASGTHGTKATSLRIRSKK